LSTTLQVTGPDASSCRCGSSTPRCTPGDLAGAIGADETLDDDVVAFVLGYTTDLDLGLRQRAFAPPDSDVPRNASPQDELLHQLGRHPNITERPRERHQAAHR
jgi:hypothetical protein